MRRFQSQGLFLIVFLHWRALTICVPVREKLLSFKRRHKTHWYVCISVKGGPLFILRGFCIILWLYTCVPLFLSNVPFIMFFHLLFKKKTWKCKYFCKSAALSLSTPQPLMQSINVLFHKQKVRNWNDFSIIYYYFLNHPPNQACLWHSPCLCFHCHMFVRLCGLKEGKAFVL